MTAFTDKTTFSATLDSKGRLTVPARLRSSLGLEAGNEVKLVLANVSIKRYQANNLQEALEIISQLDNVQEFSFADGQLKVVRDG